MFDASSSGVGFSAMVSGAGAAYSVRILPIGRCDDCPNRLKSNRADTLSLLPDVARRNNAHQNQGAELLKHEQGRTIS